MVITLHGKGFEPTLIDVARSITLARLAPSSRMRGRHLMHAIGEALY